MSDAFILRRGGAGEMPTSGAVLHITSVTGNTITLSKGSVVVKVLGPEKGHLRADDSTVSDWYFPVGMSNYGEWTVTASRGKQTESKTISVESNKQYEVKIADRLVLFANNKLAKDYECNKTGEGTFMVADGALRLYVPSGGSLGLGYLTPKINLSAFANLHVDIRPYNYSSVRCVYAVGMKSDTSANADFEAFAEGHSYTSQTTVDSLDIDVSDLVGEYYFAIYGKSYGTSSYNNYLDNVVLS